MKTQLFSLLQQVETLLETADDVIYGVDNADLQLAKQNVDTAMNKLWAEVDLIASKGASNG